MSMIHESYINALLADASYVRLQQGADDAPVGQPLKTVAEQNAAIAARLTQPQADYITTNFEVVDQELSPTGGFDATVWRIKSNSSLAGPNNENAGKVYISMRGTQGGTDIADDVELAATGVPSRQAVSMVNWWLRMTTPANAQAVQIQALYHVAPGIPTPIVVFDGYGIAPSVAGAGTLVGQSSIAGVNGHSLGSGNFAARVRYKCYKINSCLRSTVSGHRPKQHKNYSQRSANARHAALSTPRAAT